MNKTRTFTLVVTERRLDYAEDTNQRTSYSYTMVGPDGSPVTSMSTCKNFGDILERFIRMYDESHRD